MAGYLVVWGICSVSALLAAVALSRLPATSPSPLPTPQRVT
ncbi:hypothetical protein [Janibacter terrae]|nr:hypothetical protein [Janibacter terrae]